VGKFELPQMGKFRLPLTHHAFLAKQLTKAAELGGIAGPQRRFNLLPGHAIGQNRQRVAQVDHLVSRLRKKSSVMAVSKNPQKAALVEYRSGSSEHSESTQIASIHAGCRDFAGTTNQIHKSNNFNKIVLFDYNLFVE
jgi:hypothetical protein